MTAPVGCLDERVLRALRMADMQLSAWENGYAFDTHGPSREAQRLVTEALAARSASRQEGETQIFTRVSELMRAIDAYAYDYQLHGKLAASRHTVQIAIYDALNQSQEAQGDRHGE